VLSCRKDPPTRRLLCLEIKNEISGTGHDRLYIEPHQPMPASGMTVKAFVCGEGMLQLRFPSIPRCDDVVLDPLCPET